MTNQFSLWFTGTFLSSRSHYHRHNWSVICRVLLCLFTKISRHHWGLLLSPKLWMVSSTFFVLLLCLTVYLLLHFGQWKNWNTTCIKASQKGAFYFLFPESLLLRLDLMSAWFSRLISKHVCSWVYILLYFCLTLFCDWSRLAVPSFEPIKCKTTTKYNLVASSTVGSLVGFMLSSHCPKEHFRFLWLLLFWFFNTV